MYFHHRKTLAVALLKDLFTEKRKTPKCLGARALHTEKFMSALPVRLFET